MNSQKTYIEVLRFTQPRDYPLLTQRIKVSNAQAVDDRVRSVGHLKQSRISHTERYHSLTQAGQLVQFSFFLSFFFFIIYWSILAFIFRS